MIETKVKTINMVWIVVKDLKAAIQFYTETAGLTLNSEAPEFGWAELSGPEGCRLGLAEENPQNEIKVGCNGVVCITVDDIEASRKFFMEKGARLIGDVMVVPGHVKMQTFEDPSGNTLQLVESIES